MIHPHAYPFVSTYMGKCSTSTRITFGTSTRNARGEEEETQGGGGVQWAGL